MNMDTIANFTGPRGVGVCMVACLLFSTALYAQTKDAKEPKAEGPEVLDLFEEQKEEYEASEEPALVATDPARYLTLTGKGEPDGEEFKAKIGAIYSIAYPLKFKSKAAGKDYVVCPIGAQWWAENDESEFYKQPKSKWQWRLLIRTPEFIKEADVQAIVEQMSQKGGNSAVKEIKLETIDEGRCVQMLHIGPYDKEAESLNAMRAFAENEGLSLNGRHHEIYLSDPNRTPPEKLRTILRQPVK